LCTQPLFSIFNLIRLNFLDRTSSVVIYVDFRTGLVTLGILVTKPLCYRIQPTSLILFLFWICYCYIYLIICITDWLTFAFPNACHNSFLCTLPWAFSKSQNTELISSRICLIRKVWFTVDRPLVKPLYSSFPLHRFSIQFLIRLHTIFINGFMILMHL
jgi:hypothetical protein